MACILLADGRRVDAAKLIGSGIDGFIIREGCHVLKIPKLLGHLQHDGKVEAESDNELHIEHLEVEKQVYMRLKGMPGVAECIECTSNGILLKYYQNGSFSEHISSHHPPSLPWKWHWILQATDIIASCHGRGVLVFDIALRNFLLTDDYNLRIIDFANSTLIPPSMDIICANVDGCTALLDILHLSNMIYSIMTWQAFSIDCAMESEWPDEDQIPDLQGIDCDRIIQNCWTRKYKTIQDLAHDLRLCAETHFSARPLECQTPSCDHPGLSVRSSSTALPPA